MSTVAADPQKALDDRVQELVARYGERCNVAGLLCDQHPAEALAYTVVGEGMTFTELTYGRLKEASERFSAALADLGVGPGDRVATLLGKSVEHLIALMGIWRRGAVHVPLFTAFAPPAIAMRLHASATKVVVCDSAQRPKLGPGDEIPADAPWQVIVAGESVVEGDLKFDDLMERYEPGFPAVALGGEAPIIQIFTSGTTGRPKGVLVPAKALAGFHAYMEFGLDLRPDDVFWNAADPGWGYGLYYGIIGSFCIGVPSVLLGAGFSADLSWSVMSQLQVTNFAAAPTVYRALRASDVPVPQDLRVRRASAAGEPLTPEVNEWARRTLGVLVHDHYGQTETGMLINNHHHAAIQKPIKAGSMGHVMPGWSASVLYDDRDEPAPPGSLGRLAFDLTASPFAWFSGYVDEPEKTMEKFSRDQRWYITGDSGKVDEDGYFHFLSRDDDVIIMAGYRIGPFDVESVLVTHPSVAEAAIIAAPDQLRGEVLEAYVVLREGHPESSDLVGELQQLVKSKFAAHAYPRTVHFADHLPKTPSGKIQRFQLRQRRRAELEAAQAAGAHT